MKCLIIAAGTGSRLRKVCRSKPLIPVLGVPMIERVIRSTIDAGATEFCVVTGYEGDRLREFLDDLRNRLGVPITILTNRDWDKGNGYSVLKAKPYLLDRFLLLMADHLFDPAAVRGLRELSLADDEIALWVDRDLRNPIVDPDDATRVKVRDGRIEAIGKGLKDFNAFDAGAFLCTRSLFAAIEQSRSEGREATLTEGVQLIAADGRARAFETSGFWIDVDDAVMLARAEEALLRNLRDKSNDGPVARYLNRPISIRISGRLVKHHLAPNQISVFSFLCSIVAAALFSLSGYGALLAGGLLAQFASVIDGCDGEVARLTYRATDYGGWFDAVLDRYADAFLLFGLTLHLVGSGAGGWAMFAGFMAIIGSFMLSYTADKYDSLMRDRVGAGGRAGLRLGRDVRVLVVLLGAVTNQVLPALVLTAVVMNLETIRRVIVARDE